ncbi:AAA family ATPase [Agarivorans sp. Alg241-V36]|uniref:AAA family ATPase n=1 Tax=Agarivorans sp. Alg241-V36 TaxID=2305992 RepID=UPI0013D4DB4D|nr:AAA family ATPase [Agarivorans sp. Alg241-V36]
MANKPLKLTLIRGLPGSGKSTLASTIDAVHLEADMYFVDKQGDYHYRADEIANAHRWCQQQTEYHLAKGSNVVVANTFVKQWEMQAYKELADKYQAALAVRVCSAAYPSIHGVSQGIIETMRANWED